jgi:hypothetical protein
MAISNQVFKKDDYYSKRGWEDETDSEGACGSG